MEPKAVEIERRREPTARVLAWKLVRRLAVIAAMYALGRLCEFVPDWGQPICLALVRLAEAFPL